MKRIVRLYFTTCVDIDFEDDVVSTDKELIEYAEKNASEYIDQEQIMNNLALQEGQTEIDNQM